MVMGLFDTIYHHELTERLAWRPSQAGELRLHGARNLAYAVVFAAIGWTEPHGAAAIALLAVIAGDVGITLWDFVEEDRTRKLPATERVTHTLLTLNYGALLVLLLPPFWRWAVLPISILPAYHGACSWLCAVASAGVVASGVRDWAAAIRARHLHPADAASLAGALHGRRALLVTGGTGFIGRRLVAALVATGHDVTVLTRCRAHAADLPAPVRIVTALDQFTTDMRVDAIVNLAGEPIASGRWTAAKRQAILASRLAVTRDVLALIGRLKRVPAVLVGASAIGWYGTRQDEVLDETADMGDGFCPSVCVAWEREALRAAERSVRVVLLRIGLVLAADGGMLARLLTPFEFGLGGRLGAGRHWMSWVHRDDLVRLIVHAIATPGLRGPVNATAPEPVRNADFTTALGRALHRPAVLCVPAAPLRVALGDLAEELLLGGQRVVPRAALGSGFRFAYPGLDAALRAIVGRRDVVPATADRVALVS